MKVKSSGPQSPQKVIKVLKNPHPQKVLKLLKCSSERPQKFFKVLKKFLNMSSKRSSTSHRKGPQVLSYSNGPQSPQKVLKFFKKTLKILVTKW